MEYQETLRIAQEQGYITTEQREGFMIAARELIKTDDLNAFMDAMITLGLAVNPEETAKNLMFGE